jgi:hypothetical protein
MRNSRSTLRREAARGELFATTYWVDGDDTIAGYDAGFARFAKENGLDLDPQELIGTSLWDHLDGDEVVGLNRWLLQQVRRRGRGLSLFYRCDSPRRRRRMRMELRPEGDSGVEVRSLPAVERRLSRRRDRRSRPRGALKICAWCDRFASGRRWLPLDSTPLPLWIGGDQAPPQITHAMCPSCSERAAAEIPVSP